MVSVSPFPIQISTHHDSCKVDGSKQELSNEIFVVKYEVESRDKKVQEGLRSVANELQVGLRWRRGTGKSRGISHIFYNCESFYTRKEGNAYKGCAMCIKRRPREEYWRPSYPAMSSYALC